MFVEVYESTASTLCLQWFYCDTSLPPVFKSEALICTNYAIHSDFFPMKFCEIQITWLKFRFFGIEFGKDFYIKVLFF